MEAFDVAELADRVIAWDQRWMEFLRVPALSMGIYNLPRGESDPQQPHTEDEVYYVVSGRAILRVADQDHPVQPGAVVYVAAGVPHRFHTIEEGLVVLVFFAPAEGSTVTRDEGL